MGLEFSIERFRIAVEAFGNNTLPRFSPNLIGCPVNSNNLASAGAAVWELREAALRRERGDLES